MWRRRGKTNVTCIACGEMLPRSDAREYDKYGNRWERREKVFEYLCKPCYRELTHQPRRGLETLLVELETESVTAADFIERYYELVNENTPRENTEHEREP